MVWPYKNFLNTSLYFGEGRTLKKGQTLAFFHFSLRFGQASKKIEASQGFWYERVGANMLFRNSTPPVCITIDVPVIAHFL